MISIRRDSFVRGENYDVRTPSVSTVWRDVNQVLSVSEWEDVWRTTRQLCVVGASSELEDVRVLFEYTVSTLFRPNNSVFTLRCLLNVAFTAYLHQRSIQTPAARRKVYRGRPNTVYRGHKKRFITATSLGRKLLSSSKGHSRECAF